MDRAGAFLAAVEAVQDGTATIDQAREVLAMSSLCGRDDLAAKARAILENSQREKAGVKARRQTGILTLSQ